MICGESQIHCLLLVKVARRFNEQLLSSSSFAGFEGHLGSFKMSLFHSPFLVMLSLAFSVP